MILPDSSAWVEFLRASASPLHLTLRTLVEQDADLVASEVVVMELLAGARTKADLATIRETLLEYPVVPLLGLQGYEEAARIYRICWAAGETIRKMTDCLIAAVAIRAGATLLHGDRDFDVIARHTDLRIEPVGAA